MALILPPAPNSRQNTVRPVEPRERKRQPGITFPARSLHAKPGSPLGQSPLSELQPGPCISAHPSEGAKRWKELSSQGKSPGRGGKKCQKHERK